MAQRPTSLVWVDRDRIVARTAGQRVTRVERRPAYELLTAPCHRAAAKTRLGWRLAWGSVAMRSSTSGSASTPYAHASKHGDSPAAWRTAKSR